MFGILGNMFNKGRRGNGLEDRQGRGLAGLAAFGGLGRPEKSIPTEGLAASIPTEGLKTPISTKELPIGYEHGGQVPPPKGAHGAIDSKISQNNLNPKNIKNQVDSETLDVYGLFEDYMFNMGTAIFNAQTQGGANRFYKRDFTMPSAYADPSDQGATKAQIMQLMANSINQSPDDTVSTQSVQDLYGLHKQQMPKYQEGGGVDESSFNSLYEYMMRLKGSEDQSIEDEEKLASLMANLKGQRKGAASQRYKELLESRLGGRPLDETYEKQPTFRDLYHFFEDYLPGRAKEGHHLNILQASDPYLMDVYEGMQKE